MPLMLRMASPPSTSNVFSPPDLGHNGFSMHRIKAQSTTNSASDASTLFGPNVLPKWQLKSGDIATPRLQGDRFRFR
ncbi:hypothetical protein LJR230_004340 [Trinickia sp. LjRoot230]|uniref:hypothetical protein n=1 Tax=Trinickia sp. LjRoot230 TaxID=3342288 RepID=UPI003ED119B9